MGGLHPDCGDFKGLIATDEDDFLCPACNEIYEAEEANEENEPPI